MEQWVEGICISTWDFFFSFINFAAVTASLNEPVSSLQSQSSDHMHYFSHNHLLYCVSRGTSATSTSAVPRSLTVASISIVFKFKFSRRKIMLKAQYWCINFSGLEWELALFLEWKKKNVAHLSRRFDPLPVHMVSSKRSQPKTLTLHANVNSWLLKKMKHFLIINDHRTPPRQNFFQQQEITQKNTTLTFTQGEIHSLVLKMKCEYLNSLEVSFN